MHLHSKVLSEIFENAVLNPKKIFHSNRFVLIFNKKKVFIPQLMKLGKAKILSNPNLVLLKDFIEILICHLWLRMV